MKFEIYAGLGGGFGGASYVETIEANTREEAEEVAIELSVEIAAKLYDIADGFYFMTPFNRTGLIARIIEAIRQEEERR